jgi:hypothetical protein
MATIPDMIRRFVERLAGEKTCDNCITERLGLSVHSQANQATRLLAAEKEFERLKGECALCGATKVVIRHL